MDIHPEYSKDFDNRMRSSWREPEDADYEHETERRGGARRATKVLAMILVVFLATGIAVANAAEVFRSVDDKGGPARLTLHEKPCTNAKVLEKLQAQLLDDRRFKASTLLYHGREWASCWAERGGVVHSMDEEGAPFQPIPRRLFRDESV